MKDDEPIQIERITLPPKIRKAELAKILGVSPLTVRRRMVRYGIRETRDRMIRAIDARRLLTE